MTFVGTNYYNGINTSSSVIRFANPAKRLRIEAGSGGDKITVKSLGSGFTAELGLYGNRCGDGRSLRGADDRARRRHDRVIFDGEHHDGRRLPRGVRRHRSRSRPAPRLTTTKPATPRDRPLRSRERRRHRLPRPPHRHAGHREPAAGRLPGEGDRDQGRRRRGHHREQHLPHQPGRGPQRSRTRSGSRPFSAQPRWSTLASLLYDILALPLKILVKKSKATVTIGANAQDPRRLHGRHLRDGRVRRERRRRQPALQPRVSRRPRARRGSPSRAAR